MFSFCSAQIYYYNIKPNWCCVLLFCQFSLEKLLLCGPIRGHHLLKIKAVCFFVQEYQDVSVCFIGLIWLSAYSYAESEMTFDIQYNFLHPCPGWSPRINQRWTALFHSFDDFQRWFREHDKHQRWSALFQSWLALIISESVLFRTEKFNAVSEGCSALIFLALKYWIFSAEQRWFSADILWISSDIYTCRWDYQSMIT